MARLTRYGEEVRVARLRANKTLLTMAQDLGTNPSFLSGMEKGRKKIPTEWAKKIDDYFRSLGCEINNLLELAEESNDGLRIDALNHETQMLFFDILRFELDTKAEVIKKLREVLREEIKK